jgi:hypothetical protein
MDEQTKEDHRRVSKKKGRFLNKISLPSIPISVFSGFLISFLFFQLQDIKRKPTFIENPLRSNEINYEETV